MRNEREGEGWYPVFLGDPCMTFQRLHNLYVPVFQLTSVLKGTFRIHLLSSAAVGPYKFTTEECKDESYVLKLIVDETGILILFLDYRNLLCATPQHTVMLHAVV